MAQVSIKKNTIFNMIKTIATIIFPLITFPYISRVLQPENVGKINFGLSIVSYFSLIASLGISTYAIRECSAVRNEKNRLSNIASQIYSINVITTIIAYIMLTFMLVFYNRLENYRTLIIVQSLSIIATTIGADWLNSAMEDFKYITIRTVMFQIISLVLMFIFVHQPEDYIKYALISLISSAGANVVNIWYRRKFCRVKMIWDIKNGIEWKRHMLPIVYLFVMILAQTIFNSVDITMLGFIHGDYDVGIYSTASKISNIINQLVASILWVIMPRMSYYFSISDYKQINSLLRKILGFSALVGLPIGIGTIMLSDDIVFIIAGDNYSEAGFVLKILMIGFIFTTFGGSFFGNAILLPSKKEKIFMIVCCISAIVNIITNLFLIPLYGAIGAAITTMFCALLMLIILIFTKDKRICLENVCKVLISPILGTILIVITCLICRRIDGLWLRVIISVFSSALMYGLVVIGLKNELVIELLYVLKNKRRIDNND